MALNDCVVTVGLGKPPCDGASTPGAEATFYLYNTVDVAAYVDGADGITEDITFKAGKGYIQFTARKGSVIVREEKTDDLTAGIDYTQELAAAFADVSVEARNAIQGIAGAEVGVLARSNAGPWQHLGRDEGLILAINSFTTEAGDSFGEGITLRSVNNKRKRFIFFDTDETATLTNITSKIVAS